jgi:hypothetical protein
MAAAKAGRSANSAASMAAPARRQTRDADRACACGRGRDGGGRGRANCSPDDQVELQRLTDSGRVAIEE